MALFVFVVKEASPVICWWGGGRKSSDSFLRVSRKPFKPKKRNLDNCTLLNP